MVKLIHRDLKIGLYRWRFIPVCNRSRMRQLRSSWHHLYLQAQHSYDGKACCKMEHNKWVMYFHHGKVSFMHLGNNYILWIIGGIPSHIQNIVFIFGPTNLDEVFVQATYIKAGKACVGVSGKSSSRKEDKRKWHGKKSNVVT